MVQKINTVPSKETNRINATCPRSQSRSESHRAYEWRLHVDFVECNSQYLFGRLENTLLNFKPTISNQTGPEQPKSQHTSICRGSGGTDT
jgi:hypothetical protein